MSPHWIGVAILLANTIIILFFSIRQHFRFKERWDVSRYRGIPVRFAHGAFPTAANKELLIQGIEATQQELIASFPDKRPKWLMNFRIEVVPPGEVRTPTVPHGLLRDGSKAGGSIRTERHLFYTPRHWVAVVTDTKDLAHFICHEVIAHIVPDRMTGNPITHDDKGVYFSRKWKAIEDRAKGRLNR